MLNVSSNIAIRADILHGWFVNISFFLKTILNRWNVRHIWLRGGGERDGFLAVAEVLPDSFLLCDRNLFSIFKMKELVAAPLKSAP